MDSKLIEINYVVPKDVNEEDLKRLQGRAFARVLIQLDNLDYLDMFDEIEVDKDEDTNIDYLSTYMISPSNLEDIIRDIARLKEGRNSHERDAIDSIMESLYGDRYEWII